MKSDNTVRALTPQRGELEPWPGNYADTYPAYYGSAAPAPSLWDYWRILLRHKWLIVSLIAVSLALGTIISLSATRIYEAVGQIVINREGDDAGMLKNSTSSEGESDYDYMVTMDTQTHVLQSDAIAKLVIRKLNLDANPTFAGKLAAPVSAVPDPSSIASHFIDPQREAALLGRFRSALRIDSIPRTRLLEVRFSGPDAELASNVVNTLIDTYIEQNYKTHMNSTMRTSAWLTEQLSDLQTSVEASQEKLVRYQKEHGILGIDDKQNIITSKLDELNKELTAAEADRIQKQATFHMAASGDPELLSNLDPMSPLAKLRSQEAELHRQIAQASVRFDSQYPAVLEMNRQMDAVQTDIALEINHLSAKYRKDYEGAMEREKLLRTALEGQKGVANELNESAIEYSVLKREADGNRQLYEDLLQKSKEAGVMSGLRSSNIRVVDPASPPVIPISPNIRHNLMISLLGGFACGVLVSFILESRDNSVHSAEQVQMVTSLPSLAVIPAQSRSGLMRVSGKQTSNRAAAVAALLRPQSEIAEAYRALRTSILLSKNGKAAKILVVTSALPQEGKTTTSVNLAVVLAQQGARVLLIEADMRRADISNVFGFEPEIGLSTVLQRRTLVGAALRKIPGVDKLMLLPAGPSPIYPSELLGSSAMKEMLFDLRQDFDHIVIDTPPVLSVTDPVLLSTMADVTLLVTRAGTTSKVNLRRVRDILSQVDARLLGVVLNAVDLAQSDHYYYNYQGRGYHDSTAVETATLE